MKYLTVRFQNTSYKEKLKTATLTWDSLHVGLDCHSLAVKKRGENETWDAFDLGRDCFVKLLSVTVVLVTFVVARLIDCFRYRLQQQGGEVYEVTSNLTPLESRIASLASSHEVSFCGFSW